jgi:hypothetical protein
MIYNYLVKNNLHQKQNRELSKIFRVGNTKIQLDYFFGINHICFRCVRWWSNMAPILTILFNKAGGNPVRPLEEMKHG